MATPRFDDVLNHLKAAAASPPLDLESRKQLYEAAKACMEAMESPMDTAYRVIYSVRLSCPAIVPVVNNRIDRTTSPYSSLLRKQRIT